MSDVLGTLSVLIPVYNNEPTLDALLDRIEDTLQNHAYEVVLVNDGSRDRSLEILKRRAAINPRLKVVSFPRNFGQHPAIAAGLDFALGDVLVLMDADLEDKPEFIPLLVDTLREQGVDVVYTTKLGEVSSARRRWSSALYHRAYARSVGMPLPKNLGTFRVFSRKLRDALRRFPERHALYGPLMFHVGFRHAVVPVERGVRPGRSSYSFSKRLRLAVNSLVTYSELPPTIFAVVGGTMVVAPLLYGGLVVTEYALFGRSLPQGLTIVVLLLSGLGGMIMLALSVLGVYIFRIFQEVLARPRYFVDELVNLGEGPDGRT